MTRIALAAAIAALWHGIAAAEPAPAIVEVVGTTPLQGPGVARDRISANVQALDGEDMNDPGAATLPDALNRRLGSVFVNEIQGNPFQPDVSYRGFTASPLLGTPQGLSVYVDGVRMNQPFGDVVSWDLIPRAAIATLALMPGSNPLFGLNTLGGALAVRTKDGLHDPGSAVQAQAGSHGRVEAVFEHGRHDGRGLHWYATGTAFRDGGWRDDSPTRLGQLFGKVGWHDGVSDVAFSAALAGSRLTGNGLQEQRLLDRDYASVYTKPDVTRNRALLLNLTGSRKVADDVLLSGNAYYRHIRTTTFNGDLNDDDDGPFAAIVNRTASTQTNHGLGGQAEFAGRLTVGAGYDASRADFRQGAQYGDLNPDRSVTPVDAVDDDMAVDLVGRTRTWSVFATDTFDVRHDLHVTLSGRYNRTAVHNRDRVNPGGGSGSLDGDHRYGRFNPALGITWSPSRRFNAYAGYDEGSRTPTAVELGCADPANPCKLPNAMAGDPPLKQVVTRTWEAGVRGTVGRVHWNAGVFRATNDDDILFVADDAAGFGYFRNFGKTRRQGIELGVEGRAGTVTVSAHYTYLHATFASGETVGGEGNSSAGADGNIVIRPGDRIPLIPRHVFKARAEWQVTPAWSAELGVIAVSDSPARGNENGRHRPDGVGYLGQGATPGHAVFDLGTAFQTTPRLRVFAQVDNLFDRRYSTASQLGTTGFDAAGALAAQDRVHSTFQAPGAPRTIRVGVRYTFD
ncbi:TonB-dependent receptor [Telluria mixta]|uniref:TonB-dependent receptor n=1 Tax=Telluria mixta TaxID=34071 RepID=A0ABT2BYW7_9BURK|nr:TonB-dependent receptor [Telluria mixta]MCS0630333.1 TonB-dependent receptor [Telluria mixta]WEM94358.1 TonB-dependent receptor [Telluria mixta]